MSTISPLPLANDILAAFGPGYTQSKIYHRPDDTPSPNLRIATPEGAEFTIYATGYGHAEHFRISGEYPFSRRIGIFTPKGAPAIQVSAKKTGEQIVKDIKRRFLPDFLSVWEEARIRAQSAENAYAAKVETYRELCAILGETPKDPEFFHGEFVIYRYTLGAGRHTITIHSAESIRIEVSADREEAIELAQALAIIQAKQIASTTNSGDSAAPATQDSRFDPELDSAFAVGS